MRVTLQMGEHDLEMEEEHLNAVNSIINQASVLENPDEVRDMQHRREELNKKSYNPDTDFYNSKYWLTDTERDELWVAIATVYYMLLLRIECIMHMKDEELWFYWLLLN